MDILQSALWKTYQGQSRVLRAVSAPRPKKESLQQSSHTKHGSYIQNTVLKYRTQSPHTEHRAVSASLMCLSAPDSTAKPFYSTALQLRGGNDMTPTALPVCGE